MKTFKLIKLKIKAQALEKIELPSYAGSVFRGNFGHSFRKVACFTLANDCINCEQSKNCPYYRVFESDYPEDAKQIKRILKPAKPYIIHPPDMNLADFDKDKIFTYGLTIIGDAIEYLPYFIFTFKEMGKNGIGKNRGRFLIKDVEILNPENSLYDSIFKEAGQKVLNVSEDYHLVFNGKQSFTGVNEVRLNFKTPVNIVVDKSSQHDFSFQPFISRLISRINALSLLYCSEEYIENPRELIDMAKDIQIKENATAWYQFKKHSARQDKSYIAGGYLGSVNYTGNLDPFMPVLDLGQYVNVGKNTVIGFGKYEIGEQS